MRQTLEQLVQGLNRAAWLEAWLRTDDYPEIVHLVTAPKGYIDEETIILSFCFGSDAVKVIGNDQEVFRSPQDLARFVACSTFPNKKFGDLLRSYAWRYRENQK